MSDLLTFIHVLTKFVIPSLSQNVTRETIPNYLSAASVGANPEQGRI